VPVERPHFNRRLTYMASGVGILRGTRSCEAANLKATGNEVVSVECALIQVRAIVIYGEIQMVVASRVTSDRASVTDSLSPRD
jgi:hypothetical protein